MTGAHRSTAARRGHRAQLIVGAALVAVIGVVIVKVALSGGGTNPRDTPAAHQTPVTFSAAAAAGTTTSATAAATATAPGAGAGAATNASASGYEAPAGSAASGASAKVTPQPAPLTYTVKPGDNLSVIAAWFKLHGYGALYEANKAVLGDNPDLIHPGQTITVSGAGLTTGG